VRILERRVHETTVQASKQPQETAARPRRRHGRGTPRSRHYRSRAGSETPCAAPRGQLEEPSRLQSLSAVTPGLSGPAFALRRVE